jgi:hypothetical protein
MGIETLAMVSLAGTVLSAGMGAMGAIQQGQAQADAANYQAAVARNNQIIAQQNATREAATGREQAQVKDFENAAKMGGILAAQGASGVDIGSGTSKEVRQSAQQIGRLDTQTIMDTALQRVRGFNVEASSQGATAQLDTMRAGQAQQAGFLGAAGSLIGGASSFSDKWLRFQTTGVPGFG